MIDDYSWRRACNSATDCVEVGFPEPEPAWRKSSYSSDSANCVEVADAAMVQVAVRDSKDPDGPVLRFPRGVWVEFVSALRAGTFDRSTG